MQIKSFDFLFIKHFIEYFMLGSINNLIKNFNLCKCLVQTDTGTSMLTHLLRKLKSDDSGTSALEFSLVAPLFVGLMMAICEFSFVFFTLTSAQQAVWSAARQLALGQVTTSAAQDGIVASLPSWARRNAMVKADKDPADATRYLVTAVIPLTNAAPTNFLASFYGGQSMTASATLPKENQ